MDTGRYQCKICKKFFRLRKLAKIIYFGGDKDMGYTKEKIYKEICKKCYQPLKKEKIREYLGSFLTVESK